MSVGSSQNMMGQPDGMTPVARTAAGLNHYNTIVLGELRIRLFDPKFEPMYNAPFRLKLANQTIERNADEEAWIIADILRVPGECILEWGEGEESGAYAYKNVLSLDFDTEDEDAATKLRLANLGYRDGEIGDPMNLFQSDCEIKTENEAKSTLTLWQDDPGQVKPKPQDAPPEADPDPAPAESGGEGQGAAS
jgi:hypothetical protein